MLYLASHSPRRAELLRQIGVAFELVDGEIDEVMLAHESAAEYVSRMACDKAVQAAAGLEKRGEDYAVLAADTIIACEGDIIGKPIDEDRCRCILRQLSAKQHLVLTAVALATRDDLQQRLSINRVSFRAISQAEIAAYCATTEPRDKAGAYAIQGRAAAFIQHLEGSYSSVMGLPLFETAELLQKIPVAKLQS